MRVGLIKKAECQRIDAFELWCWRRLLRVPWTARRSNQSILKEISPEYSLERLMLKLKLQYFSHLMQGTDSFEKTLMLGNIEGGRKKGMTEDWMASPTQWTWAWVNSRSWWWTGRSVVLQSMGSQRVRRNWATELNWALLNVSLCITFLVVALYIIYIYIYKIYPSPPVSSFYQFKSSIESLPTFISQFLPHLSFDCLKYFLCIHLEPYQTML